MSLRKMHARIGSTVLGLVLLGAAGCPEESAPAPDEPAVLKEAPAEPGEPTTPEPQQAPETAGAASADASPEVEALLAQADALDGTVDKVVSKCPYCHLAMDGSPEHTLVMHGYTLRFCTAYCQEKFAEDTTKSIRAMFPEK